MVHVHLCCSLSVSFHKLMPPLISDLASSFPLSLARFSYPMPYIICFREVKKRKSDKSDEKTKNGAKSIVTT